MHNYMLNENRTIRFAHSPKTPQFLENPARASRKSIKKHHGEPVQQEERARRARCRKEDYRKVNVALPYDESHDSRGLYTGWGVSNREQHVYKILQWKERDVAMLHIVARACTQETKR